MASPAAGRGRERARRLRAERAILDPSVGSTANAETPQMILRLRAETGVERPGFYHESGIASTIFVQFLPGGRQACNSCPSGAWTEKPPTRRTVSGASSGRGLAGELGEELLLAGVHGPGGGGGGVVVAGEVQQAMDDAEHQLARP